jgi:hypothetical protein
MAVWPFEGVAPCGRLGGVSGEGMAAICCGGCLVARGGGGCLAVDCDGCCLAKCGDSCCLAVDGNGCNLGLVAPCDGLIALSRDGCRALDALRDGSLASKDGVARALGCGELASHSCSPGGIGVAAGWREHKRSCAR